ncbi:VWA domain-containing protein [Nakamurella silvestris]|nr:VWA domain-containing protein [Nakamurella silvestris]
MNFAHAPWLALAAVAPVLLGGYILVQRRKRKQVLRFSSLALLETVAPTRPSRSRHVPTALLLLGIVVLAIGLAGPTDEVKVPRNRATVMLAIDVSLSMEATDIKPTRLAAAQASATQFANDLTPGVNLGFISFAGVATVLVTPTTERQPVIDAVANLKLDERTATGEAIYAALRSIDTFTRSISGADGPAPARIVLMTDGKETYGRDAYEAAAAAKEAGVPISTIAFGTRNATIDVNGEPVDVAVDEASMRDIAQISGGDFHAAASAEELSQVYAQLGEQIGYEIKNQDASRPWVIGGTIVVILAAGAALVLTQRIP